MLQPGEVSRGPEITKPDIEHQQEALAIIKVAHNSILARAGTIDRLLLAVPKDDRERIGSQPTAWVYANYYPEKRLWLTGIKVPLYKIDNGNLERGGQYALPVCEEPDEKELVMLHLMETITEEDAFLLSSLRQDLVAARDSGELPDLGIDLTYINSVG